MPVPACLQGGRDARGGGDRGHPAGPEPPRSWDMSRWLELSSAPQAAGAELTDWMTSPHLQLNLPSLPHPTLLFISLYLAK